MSTAFTSRCSEFVVAIRWQSTSPGGIAAASGMPPGGDPKVVPVEAVRIPVAEDQGGLAGIPVEGDMVGHEAVAQGVLPPDVIGLDQ